MKLLRSFILYAFATFSISAICDDSSFYIYGDRSPTFNIFGGTGLIVLPVAKNNVEGSINFTFSNNQIFRFGSITITPFEWLEASYFYYRPKDLWWTDETNIGKFLDKGFSLKASKKLTDRLNLAIGLDDFAGTGFFGREYIIGTYDLDFMRLTSGIGFGKFIYKDGLKNPLGYLDNSFNYRNLESDFIRRGGTPSYDQWFKGNIKPLFGAEFFLKRPFNKLTFKIEHDPFNYIRGLGILETYYQAPDEKLRKKDSNINFGISYPINKGLSFNFYYLKGNTFNLSFSLGGNFSQPFFRKSLPKDKALKSNKGSSAKESFYEDLILNINNKSVFLQTAALHEKELKVAISSSKYRNPIHMHAILEDTVREIIGDNSFEIENLTSVGINVGKELYRITSPFNEHQLRENIIIELLAKSSKVEQGNGRDYQSFEFRPIIKYPASFTGIAPALVNHIGDPAKFYYGGIILRLDNEIQFSSSFQLNTEIHQNLTNNFDEKRNFPDSLLPRVRTDIVSYLQNSDSYISRMQFDYFFNPYKEIFGKLSAGLLENMYAGAGVEFLYKPFEQNFSVGLEAFRAKKRDFDRKFDLLNYEITTGHINFNYHLPQWGILGTLSFGRYLAGDKGYTFDISRRLASGFRAGIFFTRTNVSTEQFGEGSFDKGFYFQIPIDLFLDDYRGGYINFKLRPLTRDGGQKLEAGNDLIGIMHNTSRAEIERDWSSFND